MNFLALLMGLGIERMLTHLFHLREFRWLDPLFDRGFARLVNARRNLAAVGIVGLALLAVLPVALAAFLLHDRFVQVPYFLFAVLVLLFSLGPRDLAEEVSDYCTAVENSDPGGIERTAKELLEEEPPTDAGKRSEDVEQAIFVQANNRIFGVVLWFALLGPAGAWLFRVLDMMRRRAAYQTARLGDQAGNAQTLSGIINSLHGVFAWLPSRLLMIGYALAGSFEDATTAWRKYYSNRAERFFDLNVDLVGYVGQGALGEIITSAAATGAERARAAMGLVRRTLWLIWCPILAVLTLYDWMS